MREIKFKAWTGTAMIYDVGCIEFFTDGTIRINEEDIARKLLQFIGIKDKASKEIYEGDIVVWPKIENDHPKVVQWCQEEVGFVADSIDGRPDSWLDSECKVIGNIYENPELIKGVVKDTV